MDKKGKLVAETLPIIAITILGGIIIISFILIFAGYIKPELGSFGCSLNIRIYSAMLGGSGGLLSTPIFMCNQYREPIEINAGKWSDCPGIADFCKKETSKEVLAQCYRQCARIQIDKLTESCWSMGGSGTLSLWSAWDRIGAFTYNVGKFLDATVKAIELEAAYGANYFLLGLPELTGITNIKELNYKILSDTRQMEAKKSAILRCYKFQIVNPGRLPVPPEQNFFYDWSYGRSWSYNLNATNPELCRKYATAEDKICSYGGDGVSYLNQNITSINDLEADMSLYLNYIAEPRQVCYIAYYQEEGGRNYVIRSCEHWSVYGGGSFFLN
ncbi:MAG: hypothetical protein QW063_00430 [Candidatus Nanoarchaeia archaeon]